MIDGCWYIRSYVVVLLQQQQHPIRSADDAAPLLHVPDALLLFPSYRQPYPCASIRLCSAYLSVYLYDSAASSPVLLSSYVSEVSDIKYMLLVSLLTVGQAILVSPVLCVGLMCLRILR